MSVKGIIMFLGMNNTRLERKILIILVFLFNQRLLQDVRLKALSLVRGFKVFHQRRNRSTPHVHSKEGSWNLIWVRKGLESSKKCVEDGPSFTKGRVIIFKSALEKTWKSLNSTILSILFIGNRKDDVCLQLHGQVSGQPKHCHSAVLDPKGRAFRCVSGSPL